MIEQKLKFQRTLLVQELKILAAQTQSSVLDTGGMQLRSIVFPSNWTQSDIIFDVKLNNQSSSFYRLKNFDGIVLSDYRITSVDALDCIPVLPFLFDAVPYFRIISILPQAQEVNIELILQPIYQGIHG